MMSYPQASNKNDSFLNLRISINPSPFFKVKKVLGGKKKKKKGARACVYGTQTVAVARIHNSCGVGTCVAFLYTYTYTSREVVW